MSDLLHLDAWSVSFGKTLILHELHLRLARAGILAVMGPGGAGKSTLLRTLSGVNDAQPALHTSGHALYRDAPLGTLGRPALVIQHARLYTASVRENLVCNLPTRASLSVLAQLDMLRDQLSMLELGHLIPRLQEPASSLGTGDQRLLAIARAYFSTEAMILLDEPTSGLKDDEVDRVIALLKRIGTERALMIALHHRGHAMRLEGDVVLLAGGTFHERAQASMFFTTPGTTLGRIYVETGGASVPRPDVDPSTLDESYVAPETAPAPLSPAAPTRGHGPRNFYWALPERLGGLPRPGIIDDENEDLVALAELGVDELICLEESTTERANVERAGLRLTHFPIVDMQAPSHALMHAICAHLDACWARGERAAVHCRAGYGRTGTVLAAYLVHLGMTPLAAIERIRSIRPRSIQTEDQLELIRSMDQPASDGLAGNNRTEKT